MRIHCTCSLRFLVLSYADETKVVLDNAGDFQNSLNQFADHCTKWKNSMLISRKVKQSS